MTKPDRYQEKKLKRLQKLALETAKLAADVFGDALDGHSGPRPPMPKPPPKQGDEKATNSSVPPTPVPKLVALTLIIDGGLSIARGVECLEQDC